MAEALQRGYERARARVQQLEANCSMNHGRRYAALLSESAAALEAVGKDLIELHDDLPAVPEFERELPALRAGGTGEAYTGVAEPARNLGPSGHATVTATSLRRPVEGVS